MEKAVKIIKWTAICTLFFFLFGYVTMLLWNWLIPSIFNVNPISFWQALGLLLLSKILFSGFGGRWSGRQAAWKSRYYQKMSHMTPEDRERFKARLMEKWCSKDKNTSDAK